MRDEWVAKNAQNVVFSGSQPVILDKKWSKNIHFLLKNVFFRLTYEEYLTVHKKGKKHPFPSVLWGMRHNFLNYFFRKIFLLNFFRPEKRMFF